METNTPEAWIAAPILVIAGLVMVLARKKLGNTYAKQYARYRDRFPSIRPSDEPIYLRPMVPIVGTIWVLAGFVLLGVLLSG